jgi:hypothetical protein
MWNKEFDEWNGDIPTYGYYILIGIIMVVIVWFAARQLDKWLDKQQDEEPWA